MLYKITLEETCKYIICADADTNDTAIDMAIKLLDDFENIREVAAIKTYKIIKVENLDEESV